MKRTQIEEIVAAVNGKMAANERELVEKQLRNVSMSCLDVLKKVMR